VKVIILAAGRGSRMKNLTDERPKCLIEMQGRPLLEWQLDAIREAGISDIGIVTGYKREMLFKYGLEEFYNPRWAETQMVTSLSCAADWLNREPCVVSYSDIFYEARAVELLIESAADVAITYDPNWEQLWTDRFGDPLLDAESFRINADGSLANIGEKPESVDEIQGQYMGLLRFSPQGWAEVDALRSQLTDEQRDKMHMTGTLQMLLDRSSVPVMATSYEGKWGEVDTEEDLRWYAY